MYKWEAKTRKQFLFFWNIDSRKFWWNIIKGIVYENHGIIFKVFDSSSRSSLARKNIIFNDKFSRIRRIFFCTIAQHISIRRLGWLDDSISFDESISSIGQIDIITRIFSGIIEDIVFDDIVPSPRLHMMSDKSSWDGWVFDLKKVHFSNIDCMSISCSIFTIIDKSRIMYPDSSFPNFSSSAKDSVFIVSKERIDYCECSSLIPDSGSVIVRNITIWKYDILNQYIWPIAHEYSLGIGNRLHFFELSSFSESYDGNIFFLYTNVVTQIDSLINIYLISWNGAEYSIFEIWILSSSSDRDNFSIVICYRCWRLEFTIFPNNSGSSTRSVSSSSRDSISDTSDGSIIIGQLHICSTWYYVSCSYKFRTWSSDKILIMKQSIIIEFYGNLGLTIDGAHSFWGFINKSIPIDYWWNRGSIEDHMRIHRQYILNKGIADNVRIECPRDLNIETGIRRSIIKKWILYTYCIS